MTMNVAVTALLLVLMYHAAAAISHKTILNEDSIMGTCTGKCEGIPTLYDNNGCSKLSGCVKSSGGWNRGFVRCDYCKCNCEQEVSTKDVVVSSKKVSITEPDIYGTCKGKCDSQKGLVRTNFRGCQEVKDCFKARNGWTRGFVRCDYCTCTCVNTKYAASYTIKNPKYDLSQAAIKQGDPLALAETVVENSGDTEQSISRELSFTFVKETSVSSSHSLEVGLSVTVEAGVSVGVASVTTSIERSMNYGYTYEAGETKTESKTDSLTANLVVPGHKSKKCLIIAHRMNIDVPYTATLETKYEDGSVTNKQIKGVYSNVDFADFRIQYEKAQPISE